MSLLAFWQVVLIWADQVASKEKVTPELFSHVQDDVIDKQG